VIFVDTNVVSESLKRAPDTTVLRWLEKHDAELALSTVVIAEIAFGIEKIRPDERASRLSAGLGAWRSRFAGRMFALTEDAAIAYGLLMGHAARSGRPMSASDGMIAAIAKVHGCPLATRNTTDFQLAGISLVDPWASGTGPA
jgi:predicted nucleic acid-binding protein